MKRHGHKIKTFTFFAVICFVCYFMCQSSAFAFWIDFGLSAFGSGSGLRDVSTNWTGSCYQTTQSSQHVWNSKIITNYILPNNYYLYDRTRSGITTFNYGSYNSTMYGAKNPSGNNLWTSPTVSAAVDAHVFAGITYDYMKNMLNRNSYDNKGGRMVTEVGQPYTFTIYLACFVNNKVIFGSVPLTGENLNCDPNIGYQMQSGAVDSVAHEWGHGVSANSYVRGGERALDGPMGEAFSDWLGIAVKHYYKGQAWNDAPGSNDWKLWPETAAQHIAGRDLENPTNPYVADPGPDYYSEPMPSDPHDAAGPANKMFYLLAHGGTHRGVTVQGIGIDMAMYIAYIANDWYWWPGQGQTLTFPQAREGMMVTAWNWDLDHGTNYEQQVSLAWQAVGVYP